MFETDLDSLEKGVRAGDRTSIGQAITLVESTRAEHRAEAADLLERLSPHRGAAHRVGITGVPGVGKSTFIDSFGTQLTSSGHRVAVLAVDPSSPLTSGSILGDKTRMNRLATDDRAFVRASPTSGTLGGVTRATREAILIVEAAGYDIVIVETVGVGQSETVVRGMVDVFVVLMLAGAGDQLQGIKKGLLELADVVVVNKADGDNVERAELAAAEHRRALHLLAPVQPSWSPPVLVCSGLLGTGLDDLWGQIELHRRLLTEAGEMQERRRDQRLEWMSALLHQRLLQRFDDDPRLAQLVLQQEAAVRDGSVTPAAAVDSLMAAWDERARSGGSKGPSGRPDLA